MHQPGVSSHKAKSFTISLLKYHKYFLYSLLFLYYKFIVNVHKMYILADSTLKRNTKQIHIVTSERPTTTS